MNDFQLYNEVRTDLNESIHDWLSSGHTREEKLSGCIHAINRVARRMALAGITEGWCRRLSKPTMRQLGILTLQVRFGMTEEEAAAALSTPPDPLAVAVTEMIVSPDRQRSATVITERSVNSYLARRGGVKPRAFWLLDALATMFLRDERFAPVRNEVLAASLEPDDLEFYNELATDDMLSLVFTDADIMGALKLGRKLSAADVYDLVRDLDATKVWLERCGMFSNGQWVKVETSLHFLRKVVIVSTTRLAHARRDLPPESRINHVYKITLGAMGLLMLHNLLNRYGQLEREFYSMELSDQIVWRDLMIQRAGSHRRGYPLLRTMLGWEKASSPALVSQQLKYMATIFGRLEAAGYIKTFRQEGRGESAVFVIEIEAAAKPLSKPKVKAALPPTQG